MIKLTDFRFDIKTSFNDDAKGWYYEIVSFHFATYYPYAVKYNSLDGNLHTEGGREVFGSCLLALRGGMAMVNRLVDFNPSFREVKINDHLDESAARETFDTAMRELITTCLEQRLAEEDGDE